MSFDKKYFICQRKRKRLFKFFNVFDARFLSLEFFRLFFHLKLSPQDISLLKETFTELLSCDKGNVILLTSHCYLYLTTLKDCEENEELFVSGRASLVVIPGVKTCFKTSQTTNDTANSVNVVAWNVMVCNACIINSLNWQVEMLDQFITSWDYLIDHDTCLLSVTW